MDAALAHNSNMYIWAHGVRQHISDLFKRVAGPQAFDDLNLPALLDVSCARVFNPVLPLFFGPDLPEPSKGGIEEEGSGGSLLAAGNADGPPEALPSESPVVRFLSQGVGTAAARRLGAGEANAFLAEERRGLALLRSDALASLPSADEPALLAAPSVVLAAVLGHAASVAHQLNDGVGFIEDMLYKQLAAAIGHEVQAPEFGDYMKACAPERFPKVE